MTDFIDEYAKPKRIRKTKTHYQRARYDDDVEEVHNRKQAGKRNHSRMTPTEFDLDVDEDDPYLDQYVRFLK
jgi:hypothetical protein